jgi:hypothetical protein
MNEGRDVHRRRMRDETTLSRDRDGSSDIVASNHPTGEVGGTESVNIGCGIGLELVLEDDETEELKIRLGGLTEAQSATLELTQHSRLTGACAGL